MVLTGLMIAAIAVGIGACMTALTVFRAMSGDPIPQKSSQLFAPQIDNWGPDKHNGRFAGPLGAAAQLYRRAWRLMRAHAAKRQTGMYATRQTLRPADPTTKADQSIRARGQYGFFPDVRRAVQVWRVHGRPPTTKIAPRWSCSSREMNEKLFGGANSVGKTVRLDDETYTVSGVLDEWRPLPRFYDLAIRPFGDGDTVFMPFSTAIDKHLGNVGSTPVQRRCRPGLGRALAIRLHLAAILGRAADCNRCRKIIEHFSTITRPSNSAWADFIGRRIRSCATSTNG